MYENIWNEWRDLLIHEFERRLTAMGLKGNRVAPGRKGLIALLLLMEDLGVGTAEILPEAIKTIKEKTVEDTRPADILAFDEDSNETIAMMGHRIGLLDNEGDLERYLEDAYQLMKPQGQILFTSLDMHTIAKTQEISHWSQKIQSGRDPEEIGMQFRYGNLMGPFYGLFHRDVKTLRAHAAATKWRWVVLHQQDDNNYAAWLGCEER